MLSENAAPQPDGGPFGSTPSVAPGKMRILSIDGGGFLGLSSAAFLAELERHYQTRCCDVFDLFCGTSTGSIIALGLANGMRASDIVARYRELGSKVFPSRNRAIRFLKTWVFGAIQARYSSAPLREALLDIFGEATLGDVAARGKRALVAAFNVTSGAPRVFKTDHSPALTAHNSYRLADVALASSAAPLYFPLAVLTNPSTNVDERFCDGGVFANSPALLGYAEAIKELAFHPKNIDVLSLSTPRTTLADRRAARRSRNNRGILHWGSSISQVMIDGTSIASEEALSRVIEGLRGDSSGYCRIRLEASKGLALDVATPEAAETLMQLGTEKGQSTPTRQQVEPFFVDRSSTHG